MQARLTFDRDRCKGCELCISVCPKHILALDMTSANVKGYHPAGVTDLSQCIACASCARICPDSVIKDEEEDTPVKEEKKEDKKADKKLGKTKE